MEFRCGARTAGSRCYQKLPHPCFLRTAGRSGMGQKMAESLAPEELEQVEKSLKKAAGRVVPLEPQLVPERDVTDAADDGFRI